MEDNKKTAREKILQYAFYEFSEKEYKQASTNSICKRAGISKGLIFHYFKSKENLFIECSKYVVQSIWEELIAIVAQEERDLFERLKKTVVKKVKYFHANPEIAKFIFNLQYMLQSQSFPELNAMVENFYQEAYRVFQAGIDYSNLRQGVTPEDAYMFIMSISQAYANIYFLNERRLYDIKMENLDAFIAQMDTVKNYICYGIFDMSKSGAKL